MKKLYEVDITYRSQWTHAGGYCGECSLQTIALKVSGMYVSQELVRQLAMNRELLVGPPHLWGEGAKDDGFYAGHLAAEKMNLSYDIFPTDKIPEPQQQRYYDWCKTHIQKGNFLIICYSFGCGRDLDIEIEGIIPRGDYHHIVNLAGIIEGASWKEDTLRIHDHLDDMPLSFPMRYMHGKDAEPHPHSDLFPGFFDRCYGMSITGKANQDQYGAHVSLCVHHVGNWRECNSEPPFDQPKPMLATIFVSKMTAGLNYRIMRSKCREIDVGMTFTMESGVEVTVERYINKTKRWRLRSIDGSVIKAHDIELALWETAIEFTATKSDFVWKDEEAFQSNSFRKYKCIYLSKN